MSGKPEPRATPRTVFIALGWIAAWAWTLAAGGGGLWLLLTRGPWPLTNGWFALASGIAVCPLLASFARINFAVTLSGWMRVAAAALFFIAGHAMLLLEGQ